MEQLFRLILKTAFLNNADPELAPSPPMPRIGVKRVLPPYLGEMGYEVKYHLARVEPWLRNGWKILARRPEFYPPGTAIEAPDFFKACDKILTEQIIVSAGAGIYAPSVELPRLKIETRAEGEGLSVTIEIAEIARSQREAIAEIQLRQLFLHWLDYEGRPLTDYDRNVFAFSETCVAESDIRRSEALRPSYLPAAFENPPEPAPAHIGVQIRAFKGVIAKDRNSDPAWMCETVKAIGAYTGLPVIAYGHPGGCFIPSNMRTTWRESEGGRGHLARELGYLKSCRLMLAPDSGWTDLMAWLGVPSLLEMLPNPIVYEALRDSFQPRLALIDRSVPLGPQIDALLASSHCLPATDPRKGGISKALFPWDY
jgi:hypothetical protein